MSKLCCVNHNTFALGYTAKVEREKVLPKDKNNVSLHIFYYFNMCIVWIILVVASIVFINIYDMPWYIDSAIIVCLLLLAPLFYKFSEMIKWGPNYKLYKNGAEGEGPFSCKPDSTYTSINNINSCIYKKTGLKDLLPKFKVISCAETVPSFTGDYVGYAEIVFKDNLDMVFDRLIHENNGIIETRNDNECISFIDKDKISISLSVPFEDDERDDDFWSITIDRKDLSGKIRYGRV